MEVSYELKGEKLYIYLYGELDESSAKRARGEIDDIIDKNIEAKKVIFNFSKLSFMDSTGIGVLLGRYKKIKKLKVFGYIQSPSVSVNKILQISGIYEIMPKI